MIQEIELKIVDDLLGFEHEGFFITEPNSSECGRFEVDPMEYYGVTSEQVDLIMKFNKTYDFTCYNEHTEPQIF